jgi:hypothetical protein
MSDENQRVTLTVGALIVYERLQMCVWAESTAPSHMERSQLFAGVGARLSDISRPTAYSRQVSCSVASGLTGTDRRVRAGG